MNKNEVKAYEIKYLTNATREGKKVVIADDLVSAIRKFQAISRDTQMPVNELLSAAYVGKMFL